MYGFLTKPGYSPLHLKYVKQMPTPVSGPFSVRDEAHPIFEVEASLFSCSIVIPPSRHPRCGCFYFRVLFFMPLFGQLHQVCSLASVPLSSWFLPQAQSSYNTRQNSGHGRGLLQLWLYRNSAIPFPSAFPPFLRGRRGELLDFSVGQDHDALRVPL